MTITYCLQHDTVKQISQDQKLTESQAIVSLISFASSFNFDFLHIPKSSRANSDAPFDQSMCVQDRSQYRVVENN